MRPGRTEFFSVHLLLLLPFPVLSTGDVTRPKALPKNVAAAGRQNFLPSVLRATAAAPGGRSCKLIMTLISQWSIRQTELDRRRVPANVHLASKDKARPVSMGHGTQHTDERVVGRALGEVAFEAMGLLVSRRRPR